MSSRSEADTVMVAVIWDAVVVATITAGPADAIAAIAKSRIAKSRGPPRLAASLVRDAT